MPWLANRAPDRCLSQTTTILIRYFSIKLLRNENLTKTVIFRKVRVGTEILLHASLRYVQYFLDAYVCTLLCSRCVATSYYNAERRKGGVGQNWRGTRKFLLRSAPGRRTPEKAFFDLFGL